MSDRQDNDISLLLDLFCLRYNKFFFLGTRHINNFILKSFNANIMIDTIHI